MVDVNTEYFQVALNYMLRLERADFENHRWTARLARAAQMTTSEFTERFEYLAKE
jgi:hypothetical protein